MIFCVILDCKEKALKKSIQITSKYLNQIGQKAFLGKLTNNSYFNLETELKMNCNSINNSISIFKITKREQYKLISHIGHNDRLDENGLYAFKLRYSENMQYNKSLNSKSLSVLKNLTVIAGLFHDLGKSSRAFQNMLKTNIDEPTLDLDGNIIDKKSDEYRDYEWYNLIRHEVLSYLIVKDIIVRENLNDSNFFEFFSDKDFVVSAFDKTLNNIKLNHSSSLLNTFKERVEKFKECVDERFKIKKENRKSLYEDISKELFEKEITEKELNEMISYTTEEIEDDEHFFEELNSFNYGDKFLINCLLYLILTHHRLPENKKVTQKTLIKDMLNFSIQTYFNYKYLNAYDFYFDFNLTCHKGDNKSNEWLNLLSESSSEIFDIYKENIPIFDREENNEKIAFSNFVVNHAREALISSDYYQSKYKDIKTKESGKELLNNNISFANIDSENNLIGDTLTEHLHGVGLHSKKTFDSLFLSEEYLSEELSSIDKKTRDFFLNSQLKKEDSTPNRFLWQYDMVKKLNKDEFIDKPFFGISVAGTGTGKTNANLLAMMTLSSHPRFSCALGLRTLTLQSYNAYENFPELRANTALFVGNSVNKVLDEEQKKRQDKDNDSKKETDKNKHNGSDVEWYINNDRAEYQTLTESKNNQKIDSLKKEDNWLSIYQDPEIELISTPIGVMTIDHIIKGVQYNKGHNMINLFRSTNSDLIIDEIDDYSPDDLLSIQKLVYFVGLSGRKVLISSATVNEVVVKSFFESYFDGIQQRSMLLNKDIKINTGIISQFSDINIYSEVKNVSDFVLNYDDFLPKLKIKIESIDKKEKTQNNKSEIIPLSIGGKHFQEIMDKVLEYHENNNTFVPKFNKKFSIGFTKFNNIKTSQRFCCENFDVPKDTKVVFINYHSKFIEIDRFLRETFLDELLKREQNSDITNSIDNFPALMTNPITKELLESTDEENIIIIVSSTNILEVGRDHDYDWSIEEVQTIKSINQSGGRVRRHRTIDNGKANKGILSQHIKVLEEGLKDQYIDYSKGYKRVGILDFNETFYNITDNKLISYSKTDLGDSYINFLEGFSEENSGECLPPLYTLSNKMIEELTNFDSLKLCNDKYVDNRLLKIEQLRYFDYFSPIQFDGNNEAVINYYDLNRDFRLKLFGSHSKKYKFRKNKGGFDVKYNINPIDKSDKCVLSLKGFEKAIIDERDSFTLKNKNGGEVDLFIVKNSKSDNNKHLLDIHNKTVFNYLSSKIDLYNKDNKLNFILFSIKIKEYHNQENKNYYYDFKLGFLNKK